MGRLLDAGSIPAASTNKSNFVTHNYMSHFYIGVIIGMTRVFVVPFFVGVRDGYYEEKNVKDKNIKYLIDKYIEKIEINESTIIIFYRS